MSMKHLFLPALLALGLCMGATPAEAGSTTKKKHDAPAASSKADGAKHHRHHKHGGKGGKSGGHQKHGHKPKSGRK